MEYASSLEMPAADRLRHRLQRGTRLQVCADSAFGGLTCIDQLVGPSVLEHPAQGGKVGDTLAVFVGDLGKLVEVDGDDARVFAVVGQRATRQSFEVVVHLPEVVQLLWVGGDRRLAIVGHSGDVLACFTHHVFRHQTFDQCKQHAVVADDAI